MRTLLAILLFALSASAQGIGGKAAIGGKAGIGGNSAGGGGTTTVTVNLGGTWPGATDTGNKDYLFSTPLITPASMTSPSWGNCNVYFTSPDAANPKWGCALYSDTTITGTVNTQNASSGSCTGNCVLWQSGTTFSTGWASHGTITIGGTQYVIASVQSTTLLTLQVPPGTQTAAAYTVHVSNSKLCAAFSSTVAATGWNSLSLSSCGTPSSNTWYWVAAVTDSATQAFGTTPNGGQWVCGNGTNSDQYGTQLASFGSVTDWPSTIASVGTPIFSDGCIASYMNLTYTTTAAYQIVTATLGYCDSGGSTCVLTIPSTGTGHGLLVWEATSSSGAPVLTPSDGSSDTFTQLGTCPTVTGGSVNWSSCLYLANRVTSGQTSITCNYTALNKDGCLALEINGTLSSGSFDVSCYDSTVQSSTPFTGCTSATTAQASEIWVSAYLNEANAAVGPWAVPLFYLGGSWNLIGNSFMDGTGAGHSLALFMQVTSSTGTCTPSGTTMSSGSNQIFTSCVTLR